MAQECQNQQHHHRPTGPGPVGMPSWNLGSDNNNGGDCSGRGQRRGIHMMKLAWIDTHDSQQCDGKENENYRSQQLPNGLPLDFY
jgi:hypothetical protein